MDAKALCTKLRKLSTKKSTATSTQSLYMTWRKWNQQQQGPSRDCYIYKMNISIKFNEGHVAQEGNYKHPEPVPKQHLIHGLPVLLDNLWFFKYELPFFVLLCLLISFFILPTQHLPAILAVYVRNCVQSSHELPIFLWPDNNVHSMREQKCAAISPLMRFRLANTRQAHSPNIVVK